MVEMLILAILSHAEHRGCRSRAANTSVLQVIGYKGAAEKSLVGGLRTAQANLPCKRGPLPQHRDGPSQEVSLQNSLGERTRENHWLVVCRCLIRRHQVQQLWEEMIRMFNRGPTFPIRFLTDKIGCFNII